MIKNKLNYELTPSMDKAFAHARQSGNIDWLCRTAARCAFFHIHILTKTKEESYRPEYETYNATVDSICFNHMAELSLGTYQHLLDLSILERNIGSLERALQLAGYADKILLEHGLGHSLKRAHLYRDRGGICNKMGQYDKQLVFIQRGLDIAKELPLEEETSEYLASAMTSIAGAYYRQGYIKKSVLYMQRGLALWQADSISESGRFRIAYARVNLSIFLKRAGRLEEAKEHLDKAHTFYLKSGNKTPQLWSWLYAALGGMASSLGDTLESVHYHKQAWMQEQKLNYQPKSRYRSYIRYLNVCRDFKMLESDTILPNLRSAIKSLGQIGSYADSRSMGLVLIGNIKEQQSQFDSALYYYDSAFLSLNPTLTTSERFNSSHFFNTSSYRFSQRALQCKAQTYHALWERNHDISELKKTEEACEMSLQFLEIYRNLLFYPNDRKTAFRYTKDIFDVALKTSMAQQALNQENRVKSFRIIELGRAYLLNQGLHDEDVKFQASIPDTVLKQERMLKEKVASLGKTILDAVALDNQQMKDSLVIVRNMYAMRLDSLLNHVRENYPVYSQLTQTYEPVSLTTTQQELLTKNTAMVSYYTTDERIYVMAITKESVWLDSVRLNEALKQLLADFQLFVSDYKYAVDPSQESFQQFVSTAIAVYKALFPEKILSLIADKEEWIVLPDGVLSYLPFEAMLTHEPNEQGHLDYGSLPYLIRERTIRYAYSATWLSRFAQTKPRPLHYLGIAPGYDTAALAQSEALRMFDVFRASPSPLLGNIEEVNSSAALFDGTVLKGSAASEEAFKSLAADYNVLHFAMHGLMDNDHPMNSQLLFSTGADTVDDGSLYAYELYNLTLNADLVVMSACNSGNGKLEKGEGIMSMARSFSDAGCPGLVMSLWQAEDRSVSDIVTSFFQHLESGYSKSTSLREAKLQYLETAEPSRLHPFYWAGMVMMGDDQPLVASMNWMYWLLLAVTLALIFTLGYRYIRKAGSVT